MNNSRGGRPTWSTRSIRSFADSNGDGIGDITGLALEGRLPGPTRRRRHLDKSVVPSPLYDGGYDVADYRMIEPRYGTLDDAEALISDAHGHGIKVVTDLVPNHTSSEHAWFVEALASAPSGRRPDTAITFAPGTALTEPSHRPTGPACSVARRGAGSMMASGTSISVRSQPARPQLGQP